MTHLSAYEWKEIKLHDGNGALPDGEHFTRAQADALIAAAKAFPLGGDGETKTLVDQHTRLKTQGMVGVLAAPGCSLEILPKADVSGTDDIPTVRARLIHMLDVAYDLKIGHGATAAMERQNHSLLDIFIRKFADDLLAETRRGLPRTYLAQEDDLPALRGRLDVVRQFTVHAVRPDRLACRFDTLSSDIPLLQIMKACVIAVRRHARAAETVQRLDELRFVLADIGDVPVSTLPWQRVRIDRTNRRWESLLEQAKKFLKREWQATLHDHKAGQGITLLFPMNDLFEKYIAALTKRAAYGTGLTITAQGGHRKCLIEEGFGGEFFTTKPDVVIKRGDQFCMIIDTKWKMLVSDVEDKKNGISQSDVYQMMAYAQLYDCPEVVLLYPHHPGLGDGERDRLFKIQNSQARVRLATINLAKGREYVEGRLLELMTNDKTKPLRV